MGKQTIAIEDKARIFEPRNPHRDACTNNKHFALRSYITDVGCQKDFFEHTTVLEHIEQKIVLA